HHILSSSGVRPGWTGLSGRLCRELIEQMAPDWAERNVYTCGPQGFMDAARALLIDMNFPMAQFHSESFGGLRTSTQNKSLPTGTVGAGADAAAGTEEESAGAFAVEFTRAGKVARADSKLTLLDLAEQTDVDVEYGCRSGNCGDCKLRLVRGQVDMS